MSTLTTVYEDNRGFLWAEYDDGKWVEISPDQSPADIATDFWCSGVSGQSLNAEAAQADINSGLTRGLWSADRGWSDPNDIVLGNAGSDYILRHSQQG